jgi:hypothetical protein
MRYAAARTGKLVGLGRLELPTSPLSGVRSNQLSYRPRLTGRGLLDPSLNRSFDQAMRVSAYIPAQGSFKEVIQPRFPYGYLVTTSPQS